MSKNLVGHLLAIVTIFIWGITFISTKVLILDGLSPFEIMLYRFFIAYVSLLIIYPKHVKLDSKKDELYCVVAGLFGVVIYFLSENTALSYTTASNVGVFVTAAPIFTILLMRVSNKSFKFNKNYFIGAAIAVIGTALVMLNGAMLQINPIGDLLAIFAAFCWGIYSIALSRLGDKHNMLILTRKMFFYSILFFIPCCFIFGVNFDADIILKPYVLANLLFLGLFASGLGYVFWNYALSTIGVVRGTMYVYFIPVITIIAAALLLNETMTVFTSVGSCLILLGVYYSNYTSSSEGSAL